MIAAVVLALAGAGCSNSGDGLSSQQKESGDRMAQIVKKGHDWNSLSQDDKQFIISTQGGDEAKAQQMYQMMTHRGSPPAPGGAATGNTPAPPGK